MDIDYEEDEQREEQKEIFMELKENIENNSDLPDDEKQQQISQLELEYAKLADQWRSQDLQHEPGQDYISREISLFSD